MKIATVLVLSLSLACSHAGHRSHGPSNLVDYIAGLESPARVEVLQVERVLEQLELEASRTVADIGSGPGVFSIPLARIVSDGLVYGVDVEPKQLEALRIRAASASLSNIIPVLASMDDPFLPQGRVDVVLIVDTYHHIEGRVDYFKRVKGAFAPEGQLVIVEWKSGKLRMGPPPTRKLADGVRGAELTEAGFELAKEFDFHELHDFEIWRPVSGETQ